MKIKPRDAIAWLMGLAITLLSSANAQAQKLELLELDPPPKILADDLNDYEVHFAGPVQTGYLMINDRGVERGPFTSYEEAYDTGMQTPWVYFWVEEVELPQIWYYWKTFDRQYAANQEASWLRSIGFDAKIETIPEWMPLQRQR